MLSICTIVFVKYIFWALIVWLETSSSFSEATGNFWSFVCLWLQLFSVVVLCCLLHRITVEMQKQGMLSGMQFYLKYSLNVKNALNKLYVI